MTPTAWVHYTRHWRINRLHIHMWCFHTWGHYTRHWRINRLHIHMSRSHTWGSTRLALGRTVRWSTVGPLIGFSIGCNSVSSRCKRLDTFTCQTKSWSKTWKTECGLCILPCTLLNFFLLDADQRKLIYLQNESLMIKVNTDYFF